MQSTHFPVHGCTHAENCTTHDPTPLGGKLLTWIARATPAKDGFFGIHAAYVYPAADFDAFETEMVKVAEAA